MIKSKVPNHMYIKHNANNMIKEKIEVYMKKIIDARTLCVRLPQIMIKKNIGTKSISNNI